MDFDKIFLDSRSQKILRSAASGGIIRLHPVDAAFLLSLGFISEYALSEHGSEYVITPDGLRYEEYLEKIEAQRHKQERAEKIRNLRSWTTTIISFLALLLSLFSLLWQTYTGKAASSKPPEPTRSAASTTAVDVYPSNPT